MRPNPRNLVAAAVATLTLLFSTSNVAAEEHQAEEDQCRLWMAPSSVAPEGAVKLALFAGVDYDANTPVGEPEIAIPLIDFIDDYYRNENPLNKAVLGFLESFLWAGDYAGSTWEASHSSVILVPGLGILGNYHSGTYNLDWSQGSSLLREKMRDQHPASRGAITPFHNLTLRSTQPIKAGMELFVNFGEVWDANRTQADDVFQEKLTRQDYKEADEVLDKIIEFMDKYESQMTPELKDDVLDFILDKVLGTAAGKRAKVIRSLIPAHPGKLRTVKNMGGTFQYRNPDLVKSPKWLKKHGRCMDNLKPGLSTIPEAGRGAFATRPIAKGDTIVPVPLLQIPNVDLMDMYELEMRGGEEEEAVPNYSKPKGKQILMNYCFGHPESSLLLFPVSPTVNLINHAPGNKANAKLMRWSTLMMEEDSYFHDTAPPDLVEEPQNRIGLIVDIVATRDIAKGEEIFIDYGPDWTKAWDDYMADWRKKSGGEEEKARIGADDLKEEYKTKPYKTMAELEREPYPDGVTTACFIETEEVQDGSPKVNEDGLEIALWAGPKRYEDIVARYFYLCDVKDRTKTSDGSYTYTVFGHSSDGTYQVLNVPQVAVTLVDEPYKSDIHNKGAFRHWIGMPEILVPQAWRDRRD